MFEQTFKNIDDVLWKEAGCATELDYTEQTSWILFLKYLDDLEKANETRAELQGKKYAPIIDAKHRWSVWAAPKKKDGSFDHDRAKGGPDLIEYVDDKLFPYLNDDDLKDFVALQAKFKVSDNSWTVDAKSIDKATYGVVSLRGGKRGKESRSRNENSRLSARLTHDVLAGKRESAAHSKWLGDLVSKHDSRSQRPIFNYEVMLSGLGMAPHLAPNQLVLHST